MAHYSGAPFTGMSAFAHKGGIHVSAVNKIPDSYQHIDPSHVGNKKRYVCPFIHVSDHAHIHCSAVVEPI